MIFEEKDKRSLTSRERNKLNSLLCNKRWIDLELNDFIEAPFLEFDFQNKNFNLCIKGIDMNKLDYSSLDLSSLPAALKMFIKQNNQNQGKKSIHSLKSD